MFFSFFKFILGFNFCFREFCLFFSGGGEEERGWTGFLLVSRAREVLDVVVGRRGGFESVY